VGVSNSVCAPSSYFTQWLKASGMLTCSGLLGLYDGGGLLRSKFLGFLCFPMEMAFFVLEYLAILELSLALRFLIPLV
jgi:hypothetical protein